MQQTTSKNPLAGTELYYTVFPQDGKPDHFVECHLPLSLLSADDTCGRCGERAGDHLGWWNTQEYRYRQKA